MPAISTFRVDNVVQQRAANRTRNLISAPESRPKAVAPAPEPEAPTSAMERAFWTELGGVPQEQRRSGPSGFAEQLDLDLYESDVYEAVGAKN